MNRLLQFKCALALARAHGHEWAGLREEIVARAVELTDTAAEAAEAIARAVAEDPDRNLMPGIDRPQVDSDGDIIHKTGTGRLTWIAWADGQVSLRVSRRAIRFLEALTDPSRGGEGIGEWSGVEAAVREGRYEEGFDAAFLRLSPDGSADLEVVDRAVDPVHMRTMRDALSALHGTEHPAFAAAVDLLEKKEKELSYLARFEAEAARELERKEVLRARDLRLPRELRERAALASCGLTAEDLGPKCWYRWVCPDESTLYGSIDGVAPGFYPDGELWAGTVTVVEEGAVRAFLPMGWAFSADPGAEWNRAIDRVTQTPPAEERGVIRGDSP